MKDRRSTATIFNNHIGWGHSRHSRPAGRVPAPPPSATQGAMDGGAGKASRSAALAIRAKRSIEAALARSSGGAGATQEDFTFLTLSGTKSWRGESTRKRPDAEWEFLAPGQRPMADQRDHAAGEKALPQHRVPAGRQRNARIAVAAVRQRHRGGWTSRLRKCSTGCG
jgi:hypothetical protein